ncbi:hypothetical protein OHS58_12180 [Amycolatopsis sp. NBC_00348]|uniref:hypothetical protein n=1 Tax=Amycolatopsis sp. NBC_00348 TaxID=2975956 RepID=UPI002E26CEDF
MRGAGYPDPACVRALLVQALARRDFRLLSVLSTDRPEDRTAEVRAELAADRRDDAQMEPAVSSVRWEAVPA